MAEKEQNIMTRVLLVVAAAVVALLLGIQLFSSDSAEPQVTESNTEAVEEIESSTAVISEDGSMVSYEGEAGKSALDLLKELTDATTQDSDFGEFVTAINGVDGGGTQFWLFYVNGEAATVGAADYQTMTGDSIEWRLE